MGVVSDAYAGCRTRIVELVDGLDEVRAATLTDGCPEWTVRDVMAHLAGVADDALAGRLEGVTTEPWTAAQVEARDGVALAAIVAEWNEKGPAFEGLLDAAGELGLKALTDVVSHEHDIRGALRKKGARNSAALRLALEFVATRFVNVTEAAGVPARILTTDGLHFGDPESPVTLRGDDFELFRALTGRRSEDQLKGLAWTGDRDAVMHAFAVPPFRPAPFPVDE